MLPDCSGRFQFIELTRSRTRTKLSEHCSVVKVPVAGGDAFHAQKSEKNMPPIRRRYLLHHIRDEAVKGVARLSGSFFTLSGEMTHPLPKREPNDTRKAVGESRGFGEEILQIQRFVVYVLWFMVWPGFHGGRLNLD